MTKSVDESNVYTKLRKKAETQLLSGTTTTVGQWSMGIDALQLLHRLSSNPDNAEDALKLLHELQVHQVELDLQNEEIASNEQALEEELGLYRALYDGAPMAYCVVDFEGTVIQANASAAELFGVAQGNLEGQRIDTFLNPKSQPTLLSLLKNVAKNRNKDGCVVQMAGKAGGSRRLQFLASFSPDHAQILLACCESEKPE